jgi:hypothetical protein
MDAAIVLLQDLTDSEKERGLCGEICPASSQYAYQAISVKAEVQSDAEAEEDPLATTLPGIKTEPEVRSVSVSMLGRFHKYKYSSFCELLLQ